MLYGFVIYTGVSNVFDCVDDSVRYWLEATNLTTSEYFRS